MSVFSVQLTARQYEVDFNGHVSNEVYFDWANHVRLEFLSRAGIALEAFIMNKVGPVILETRVRYLKELHVGECVTVTCEPTYGSGKTFTYLHRFLREDGIAAAELTVLMGMLDHRTRRLVAKPHELMRSLATRPEVLESVTSTVAEGLA
jgi:acyl-CoA thioester hydrolase